jgi:adenylosuccinate lyase
MQAERPALRVADPGIRALFAEESRFQSWLDVEAALAQAQAELGVIPMHAAAQASVVEGRAFRDTLAEVDDLTSRLTPQKIESLLDPARYSGMCRQFAEQGAVQARKTAPALTDLS